MRFILVLALLFAATAFAQAQTKSQIQAAERHRPGLVNNCVVQLRQNPHAGKHPDATRRIFCNCAFDHMVRASKEEWKDYNATKLIAGSMGERMYIAAADCFTKAKMWPTAFP